MKARATLTVKLDCECLGFSTHVLSAPGDIRCPHCPREFRVGFQLVTGVRK